MILLERDRGRERDIYMFESKKQNLSQETITEKNFFFYFTFEKFYPLFLSLF